MLKPYLRRDKGAATIAMCTPKEKGTKTDQDYLDVLQNRSPKLQNAEILSILEEKLNPLKVGEQTELSGLIEEFKELISDVPRRTNMVRHEMDVRDAKHIKEHPYRTNSKQSSVNESRNRLHAGKRDNRA